MHHKRIAFGLLAALASMASAEDKSDVHQLTEKTFDEFIKANPLVLAECEFLPSQLHPTRRLSPTWQLSPRLDTVATFVWPICKPHC
jgi:hypothetical protein